MELYAMKLFHSNREGLVELEDDVLSIVAQVREAYGDRVKICLEPTTGQFVFSENGADGTERLIFTAEALDARCLTRLMQADSHGRGYTDAYDLMEREQDELRAQQEEANRARIRDEAERLAHALKRGGAVESLPLTVPISKGLPDA
jgi:hypothetical protein